MTLLQNPAHPGEILQEEFLPELGLSAETLAKAVQVPPTRIECLVRQETGVTADMATGGQVSDFEGARTLLPDLPAASFLLADKGYDANWFHDGLIGRGTTPCIPPKKNRKFKHRFDKILYKQRHKVENMFGRLKDWRRIAARYDRCAHTFFAATVIWRL